MILQLIFKALLFIVFFGGCGILALYPLMLVIQLISGDEHKPCAPSYQDQDHNLYYYTDEV